MRGPTDDRGSLFRASFCYIAEAFYISDDWLALTKFSISTTKDAYDGAIGVSFYSVDILIYSFDILIYSVSMVAIGGT